MKEVTLWNLRCAVLIVPEHSGVFYTNQIGGTRCETPRLEGILIPICNLGSIDHPEGLIETQLANVFDGNWGVGDEQADRIDEILSRFPETSGIKVDRQKLLKSQEAWVYVIAQETDGSLYRGFGTIKGVLTWENSD